MAGPTRPIRAARHAVVCTALLVVLGGGGGFHCSWSSGGNDDDDSLNDDDDSNAAPAVTETAGAPGLGIDIQERLEQATDSPAVLPDEATLAGLDLLLPPFVADDYRLHHARVTRAHDLEAGPVVAVQVDGAPAIMDVFGPGSYGPAELATFADRVRLANAEWFALPEQAGALHLEGTVFLDDVILVRWVQTLHTADDPSAAIAGAHLTIVLDALGRVIHVENAVDLPW